jgi:hypothetical protein
MKSNVSAIRAVTAEFAQRFIQPFIWTALGMIVFMLIIVGWLAIALSEWWWLLVIPIFLLAIIGTVIWLIVRFILNRISPRLTAKQTKATKQFVTKLQFATEAIQTPYPVIIFYVMRDIILRKDSGFISEVTQQSKTLRPDFDELRKLFEN